MSDIARRSGGSYLNLAEGTIDDAVDLLAYRPVRLASVRVEQGDVDGLYPVGGQVTNDMITVGGIMKSDEAVIELQFESGPGTTRLERIRISSREDFDSGTTIARLWAHNELDRYGADPVRNEAAITAIGQRFGIVTQGTSLIVLELLEDYVRFNIEPPASEPALLAQWAERRKGIVDDSVRRRSLHKEEMLALWNQRKEWYERVFEPSPNAPYSNMPLVTIRQSANSNGGKNCIVQGMATSWNGEPIKGVRVHILNTNRGGISRQNGAFTIINVRPGSYQVQITAAGYDTVVSNVDVLIKHDYAIDIRLPKADPSKWPLPTNVSNVMRAEGRTRALSVGGANQELNPPPGVSAKGNGFNIRGSRTTTTTVLLDEEGNVPIATGSVVPEPSVKPNVNHSGVTITGQGFNVRACRIVNPPTTIEIDPLSVHTPPANEEVTAQTSGFGADGSGKGVVNDIRHMPANGPETADALRPAKPASKRDAETERRNRKDLSAHDDVAQATAASAKAGKIMLIDGDSSTSYLSAMKAAKPADAYRVYLTLRPQYENSPQFYLDAADILRSKGRLDEALRVLSNIAELKAEDHEQLRVLASRLLQLGHADLAVLMYEDVLRIRGEEPQSYRDLGLALAAAKRYPEAIRYLYAVVDRSWDSRFPEVEMIALNELNHLVAKNGLAVDTTVVDPRFIGNMPVDVRIVLAWDADNTDVDMWVTDPSGEKCFYGHRETSIGGRISRDLTGGYGPEEFLLKNAAKGAYKVQANYFSNSRQRASGPATIQLELYTHYGKPNETKKTITLPLTSNKQTLDIGTLMME